MTVYQEREEETMMIMMLAKSVKRLRLLLGLYQHLVYPPLIRHLQPKGDPGENRDTTNATTTGAHTKA